MGWHEVTYVNTIATQCVPWAIYFIVYIAVVSIIIANVFVGLLLADIDKLDQEQSRDEIVQHSLKSKSFEEYAREKTEALRYQLKAHDHEKELIIKQIVQIDAIL